MIHRTIVCGHRARGFIYGILSGWLLLTIACSHSGSSSSRKDAGTNPDTPSTGTAAGGATASSDSGLSAAGGSSGWDAGGTGGSVTCAGTGCASSTSSGLLSCSPGKKRCQSGYDKIIVCTDDGLNETVVEDCSARGLVCGTNMECVPAECKSGETKCDGPTHFKICSTNRQWVVATCPSTYKCAEGECRPIICSPGEPVCNAEYATTCNADGTGGLPGGTSCPDQGKFCNQGACQECWQTTYFCSGASVRHCSADGTSTLSGTCTSSQFCDGGTGACRPRRCNPGQPACNGDVAATCNADGSGFLPGGTSCKDAGKSCQQGTCTELACSPGQDFCAEGPVASVRRCADDGNSSTEVSTCTSSQYCDRRTVTCQPKVCTPNAPLCLEQWATACNSDGSGYLASGHACDAGTDGICVDGRCVKATCKVGERACLGNAPVNCSSNGRWYPGLHCEGQTTCDHDAGSCKPLLCMPGRPACDGNKATLCSPDGQGFVGEGKPCGTQHCVGGTCQDALFVENFENTRLEDWQGGSVWDSYPSTQAPVAIRTITPALAAAGTHYSLMQRNTGHVSNTIPEGVSRTFPGLKPSRVSWWVLAPSRTVDSGFTTLISSSRAVFFAVSSFKKNGTLALSKFENTPGIVIPYAANIWYHIELRKIDWSASTFDYYVNDTLIQAAVPFGIESPNGITGLGLENPGGSTAYWDEITFD